MPTRSAIPATFGRPLGVLRRWRVRRALRAPLAQLPENRLKGLLAAAGMRREDLFRLEPSRKTDQHRRLMAQMMAHFQVDVGKAVHHHWRAIKLADSACLACRNRSRCRRWLAWGLRNDAPRAFCPNAGLFERLAGGQSSG